MSEIERESMPVDVIFVGGGPACLAGALHLMGLIEKHNETAPEDEQFEEPMIGLIEKGSEIGSHKFRHLHRPQQALGDPRGEVAAD